MSEIQVPGGGMECVLEECDRRRSPTSVLGQTICKLHSRDFSDCFKYHKQHPFWDKFQPSKLVGDSVRRKHSAAPNKSTSAAFAVSPVRLFNNVKRSKIGESCSDPMKTLGPDVMELVFLLLDARSLARSGSTSKRWKSLAYSDTFWRTKCTDLWAGKQSIPAAALLPGLSKLAAYGISLHDSRRRAITIDDLCGHNWEFRFKDTVPQYWLELDPSKRGEAAMQRFFHRDGSQTALANDPVWGGHESSFTINMETFVRINSWPEMSVSRTPDWGWQLQNNFYVYNSFIQNNL